MSIPAHASVRPTALLSLALLASTPLMSAATVDFARDIQPILADRCYSCHGPEKQKSGLRLDQKSTAFLGGDSGAVLIPRDSAKSLLYAHISGGEPDAPMPPESEGKPLTPAQIALIKAWIDAGAVWPDDPAGAAAAPVRSSHWSFQAPQRPELPAVKNASWPRTPIDRFVMARLDREKIVPSPEAGRPTLIRRLSFDLLGLPPSPVDVQKFVNDTRPDAYERLVDRLLASPHFGERWGRHWLDLARYADSDGYEKDTARPFAYLYRDWVIDAINRDLPFDQFTIEQLAGDLLSDADLQSPNSELRTPNPDLPSARQNARIATGFHRQTLTNKEGGVDPEEFRCKATVDRVDTTGTVWLGLTLGCAECHSHKYDPISQREFYQLFAFFNNADEQELPAPTAEQLAIYTTAKKQWDATRAPLKKAYDAYVRDSLPAQHAEWEAAGRLDLPVWTTLTPEQVSATSGTSLTARDDHVIAASGMSPLTEDYVIVTKAPAGPITGFRLEAIADEKAGKGAGRSGNGNYVITNFSVSVQSTAAGESQRIHLINATADFSQKDYPVGGAIDGNTATGWAINGESKKSHVAVFHCAEPLTPAAGDKLNFTIAQQFGNQHTLARFRLSATTSPAPKASLIDDQVAIAWHTPPAERTPKHQAALTAYYRDEIDATARKLRKPLLDHAKKEPKYPDTKAAILAERAKPRETHVHIRGDFLRPGPKVTAATPAVLHAMKPRGATPDRLDLARWLVAADNPLTARVTVNHLWKNLFGRGLVASVNNFGLQGDKPTHPELLDWLATEFSSPSSPSTGSTSSPQAGSGQPTPSTGLGWSRKALLKLIVTSATYQQSSDYRTDLVDLDPLNTLLARQNRLRLEAEIIRDTHLAVSGLLAPRIGGPSVRPPLPADIAALGYANSVKWQESEGADKYRRGLYIFFQRTVPYPMLMTFDAPNSTATCTRRERSNTPLQALMLWNDPVFFDCARVLGRKLMGEPTIEARLDQAFETCLARPPTAAERTRLRQLYDDQARLTAEQPAAAKSILGLEADAVQPADPIAQAALVAAVRTLMNLDEFITRD